MRTLDTHKGNGLNAALDIHVLDEPGAGGACHDYRVDAKDSRETTHCLMIHFQNGPVAEVGVNGISNEAILAIVLDRLQGFQSGQFACDETQMAMHHVRTALDYLQMRTRERTERGVEGTLQP